MYECLVDPHSGRVVWALTIIMRYRVIRYCYGKVVCQDSALNACGTIGSPLYTNGSDMGGSRRCSGGRSGTRRASRVRATNRRTTTTCWRTTPPSRASRRASRCNSRRHKSKGRSGCFYTREVGAGKEGGKKTKDDERERCSACIYAFAVLTSNPNPIVHVHRWCINTRILFVLWFVFTFFHEMHPRLACNWGPLH